MGRKVSKGELAEVLGLTLTSVDKMLRRGCPYETKGTRGKAYTFDTAEVIAWREQRIRDDRAQERDQHVISLDRERALKTAAERKLAELELAQRSGELVLVDDVASAVEREYANVRARLQLIPTKLAPKMPRIRKAGDARKLLHDEVREALHELSSGDEIARDVAEGLGAADLGAVEGEGEESPTSA